MKFDQLKQKIDINYKTKIEEQQNFFKKHWTKFNKERNELEKIVGEKFEEVLDSVGPLISSSYKKDFPEGAKVLEYKVDYNPQFKYFKIKITKLQLPDGRIIDDEEPIYSYGCPHLFTNSVCSALSEDKKIKNFKKKYFVQYIENPDNDCEHK